MALAKRIAALGTRMCVETIYTVLTKCVLIKNYTKLHVCVDIYTVFRLVLGVQNLYEAVITSLSFHNPFEIGLMKRVRYLVEVSGQCLRSWTFDDIVHRSRTESI